MRRWLPRTTLYCCHSAGSRNSPPTHTHSSRGRQPSTHSTLSGKPCQGVSDNQNFSISGNPPTSGMPDNRDFIVIWFMVRCPFPFAFKNYFPFSISPEIPFFCNLQQSCKHPKETFLYYVEMFGRELCLKETKWTKEYHFGQNLMTNHCPGTCTWKRWMFLSPEEYIYPFAHPSLLSAQTRGRGVLLHRQVLRGYTVYSCYLSLKGRGIKEKGGRNS